MRKNSITNHNFQHLRRTVSAENLAQYHRNNKDTSDAGSVPLYIIDMTGPYSLRGSSTTSGSEIVKMVKIGRASNRAILLVVFFITMKLLCSDLRQLLLTNTNSQQSDPLLVPGFDLVFSGLPIANRTFEEVRNTYNIAKESARPMRLVRLPNGFQSQYHPESVKEFQQLAHTLLDTSMGDPVRNSSYAIVSVCIGMEICDISHTNRQHYASLHGYDTLVLTKPILGVQPKMLKYLLLAWALERGYDWLFMSDSDALITNSSITLPSLLQEFQPSEEISLIATRGGQWKKAHVLNNGIFFLKNTEWSMLHCYQIFTAKWSYTRFLGKTLVDQPIQASLLLAQNELQWPPPAEEERGRRVMIVHKTKINSFRRDEDYSNTDAVEGGQWQRGDFIAHFASGNKYSLMLDLMKEEGLPGIPRVERRYAFQIPLPGADTNAGTCWCEDGQLRCVPKFHVIGVHKAGTKAILQYMAQHPGIARTPYIEDPARWLTDAPSSTQKIQCEKKRQQKLEDHPNELPVPVVLGKKKTSRGTQHITTCSFQDYSLLYGKYSSKDLHGSCSASASGVFSPDTTTGLDRPKYDEMVIWEKTFHHIRGIPLPKLFRLMQPSAKLLVTVRSSVSVTYSAYSHFGVFAEEIEKGPEHFDALIRELMLAWVSNDCTPDNFLTCLPRDLVKAGSWLSRGMYSKYLPPWLDQFGCSQIHIFDVSEDQFTEVKRLYEFMGVPDEGVALNATTATTNLLQQKYDNNRLPNLINKGEYAPMMDTTMDHLEAFFEPYYKEMCSMMSKYPCLRVPLFLEHCP